MTYVAAQSVFRELEPHEIDLVSGGFDGGEGQEIVVYGHPVYTGPQYDPGTSGYEGDGTEGTSGGYGIIASNTPGVQITQHSQTCSSASGAAVQVANHVKGTGSYNPTSAADGSTWNGTTSGASLSGIEFSALIVYTVGTNTYGPWFGEIWTKDSPNSTFMPTAFPGNSMGFFHNHPDRGDATTDAHDAYPSPSDWQILDDLKQSQYWINPDLDPSLWLMDPNGVVREFKLSERSYFESLSLSQMSAMTGLSGRERSTSCGG